MTNYTVYDVFTDQAFGGNPLAVVFDADHLTSNQMQIIAREFGLSETTFVLQPEDAAHDAKVRIFTPVLEMQFAGHPTVGTALALRDAGRVGDDMVLELGVGPIPVAVQDGNARFVTKVPLQTSEAASVDAIAACIGLDASALRVDRHGPITAGLGTDFVLAELNDRAALADATPDVPAFRTVAGPDAARMGILVYCRDEVQIDARMFAPLGGIMEDPATGSAAAALVAYLGQLERRSNTYTISQGVDMGRPSLITGEVTVENGQPVAVAISGKAVKVMEGRLTL